MSTARQRDQLEHQLAEDLRTLTSESDWAARRYAADNAMSYNDFRAVVFAVIGETSGHPLTAGDLRRQLGLSGAAVSYLMPRMTEMGHLRLAADLSDRRKTLVHPTDRGVELVRGFRATIMDHTYRGLDALTDADLQAAHTTFTALIEAMSAFRADIEAAAPDV